MYTIIVWNNAGDITKHPVGHQYLNACVVAKQKRTVDNRTVKIADAFSSTDHWVRTPTEHNPNHWSRMKVADDIF